MTADGLTLALEAYQRAQDELVEARNRLAQAIAGAAMSGMMRDEIVEARNRLAQAIAGAAISGMMRDEIVEATGYPGGASAADLHRRWCQSDRWLRTDHRAVLGLPFGRDARSPSLVGP